MKRIKEEHAKNKTFVAAFASFLGLCRASLDPNMSSDTVDEMLVQHLLTERLFRTIFNNPDFTRRNIIAAEIEKVIQTLTSTLRRKTSCSLSHQSFPLVGPFERLGHGLVVIVDESQDFGPQVLNGSE